MTDSLKINYLSFMKEQEIQAFYQLKKVLGETYAAAFPGAPADIRSLSGQELARFQEHLMESVQGRVSEKWFYSHIKPASNDKLPRIDVLDLLSKYAGWDGWMAFRDAHVSTEPSKTNPVERESQTFGRNPRLVILMSGLGIALILLLSLSVLGSREKKICFTDAVLGSVIQDSTLRVTQILEGESPRMLLPDPDGCVVMSDEQEILTLVIQVPYYQTDTLVRSWKELQEEEMFALMPDDVANMLRYFATWAEKDRMKRTAQLSGMMSPALKVIRMHADGVNGVEMYNREEFIRFLLVFGQKKMEVLETTYENGLLTTLRFMVKQ